MPSGSYQCGDVHARSWIVLAYNVSQQPINDESSLVRPANLRGLPPDNTLILVNGKRRHRGGVINFLGDGIRDILDPRARR